MDQMTRDALEASIKHWQEIAEVSTPDQVKIGPYDCALCQMFNIYDDEFDEENCIDCPVNHSTGKRYCNGSPFEKVWQTSQSWIAGKTTVEDFRVAAKAELDFLISLRPTDAALSTPHTPTGE